MQRTPSVVIVGGGFGGLRAAKALRKARANLTLIDRNNHHLFQPLLYQVATAGLNPSDIASPIRHILRDQKNTEVIMGEVKGVDASRKRVLLEGREIPYDYLVLATGADHSYFGKNEWARHAPGLKTVEDATTIRRKVLTAFERAEIESAEEAKKAWLTFVLVGGGPTGVEMAGSIAELSHHALASDFRHIDPTGTRILLLEASPKILASFPDELSAKAKASLERLGVEVRTGGRVEQVDENGVVVAGERIASRTVIWAAGVVASPAGKWLGAEMDRVGRVKVNSDLTVPGMPEVFVIGDTALLIQDGEPLPGVAPVAMQQGRYAAAIILKKIAGDTAYPPFHYLNKGNLATIGRSSAIADLGKLRLSGFLAWMTWLVVHVFYLIGFRNRLLVIIQWAWAYLTFQRGARLITHQS